MISKAARWRSSIRQTLTVFRRFQAALLTLAKEWRDPDLAQPTAPATISLAAVTSTV
jgi:hypothetical protein